MKASLQSEGIDATGGLPLAHRLPSALTAVEAIQRLSGLPHAVFFDSATHHATLGRYSFVAADPFDWIELPADSLATSDQSDPLAALQQRLDLFRTATRNDLPPFQGGAAGLLGYELGGALEPVSRAGCDDLPMPALAVGLYDVALAFDHLSSEAWIVSQGFPELESTARQERAAARIAQFLAWLERPPSIHGLQDAAGDQLLPLSISEHELAPQFKVEPPGVTSNMSAGAYRSMVRHGIEHIYAGDVYQVNLSQRLLCPAAGSALNLYLRLRERNPAPYAGYLDLGGRHICSASPECFLRVRGGLVETRPIKGTRGRASNPEADLFAGDDLRVSEKDRAENVMIVDLLRNDLSRACTPQSVHVDELFGLETFAYVKHLVSSVRGRLREAMTPADLLRAAFPGGSITGAPKIRAMQIIAELEPTVRGPYCGSLAYVGFDGQMDASILIRTISAVGGWWQLPVGGGIVADSDPDDEYRETWHKAKGLLRAIRP